MNLHRLLIIALALSVTACGDKEQVAPEPMTDKAAPAAESMATAESRAESKGYDYDGILRHMHAHADQIDLLNNALADDDLDGSKVPARWLWRHETLIGVPDDWQPYLTDMRQAARDVGSATDLEAARAAATRIEEQCQACHKAVGINGHGVKPL